ncbi:MAG: group I truncated hemoglobin [Actinomycetota bacterium]
MAGSLYERLGGASGIKSLVDEAIAAHLSNPVVRSRFENAEDLEHAARMAAEFFAAGSGGPEIYTGKDMRSAHEAMDISDAEFDAVVEDIMQVVYARGIDDVTKQEVLGILESLRPEIVGL